MTFLLSLALAAEPAPPATFADLVAQVGAHTSSTAGCLLGGTFLNLSSRVDLVPPGVVQRAICAP